jgi:hypothetical protein
VGSGSFNVTITSDNRAVATDGTVVLLGGQSRIAVTISVPGTVGAATLTATAAGLASATATLGVLP